MLLGQFTVGWCQVFQFDKIFAAVERLHKINLSYIQPLCRGKKLS
jgi:hypothetical protein